MFARPLSETSQELNDWVADSVPVHTFLTHKYMHNLTWSHTKTHSILEHTTVAP